LEGFALVAVATGLFVLGLMQYRELASQGRMLDRLLTTLLSVLESQDRTIQRLIRVEETLLDRRYR
jgi:hypothetical protein